MTRLNLLCLGIVALLIACIVSTPAHSGGCYSGASYSYGYGASYYPSYSYYSAPTYSYYTPSYTPTYYTPKYEVQEVVVPRLYVLTPALIISPAYRTTTETR
jgi:hypothetical protein